jgi:catechol 2,3-dioxygenase-like lactoylglutathione lyase family enzyme
MPNILQVTPFMFVPDLKMALDFMVDVLGFGMEFRSSDYGGGGDPYLR